ncbi:uncharacterized protein LOC134539629 [Bacillus rossius redtenbacheri]|uniref:uncharacterized protein LOC134539629 n=1 Tax=Bacillus rossius redtenbacheri TaxID=93214 RepID=UPI002FDEAA9F
MGCDSKFFPAEDDGYRCGLDEETRRVASSELREDEAARAAAVQQLRDWVLRHPAIRKCRTDSVFLLRFLRSKKFSVPLAQEMLERYLTVRQLYPLWFRGLSADEPVVREILLAGYLVPLPERDEFGRRVILRCAGTYSHIFQNCLYFQKSTPMRHKSSTFLNLPHYASKFMEFFVTLLNEKLKSRIKLISNTEELQKIVNIKILPKEYGGEMPLSEMIDKFLLKLEERREAIKALDEMEMEVDQKTKFVTDLEDELAGVAGSFRQLEVD